ncbi:hypothetical protein AN958_00149 [Leucoagaricus sp. SymC.cos]|nr:hypothetical protein AN958_00149 [Leucoagaricus sp. SymC.cos]
MTHQHHPQQTSFVLFRDSDSGRDKRAWTHQPDIETDGDNENLLPRNKISRGKGQRDRSSIPILFSRAHRKVKAERARKGSKFSFV